MVDPKLARAYGTLAGFGFIGAALLALPSTRLLDPTPAPEAYLLTLLGLVTGLVCLAIPWDWLDPRWLHVAGGVATVEAAATVAVFGMPYVAFYFLIAVLVAYVAPDPRTLGIQVGLIALALFGPVLYGPEDARSSLNVALVAAPPLLLTVALFSYLRMKMVHDRRAYHRFAEQTLVLSSRIAGRQIGPMGLVPHPEPVSRFSGFQPPARWIAVAAALLGIPLFAGSLAVAGVRLPEVATDPFERVGIKLPNQEPEASAPAPVEPSLVRAQARRRATDSAGDRPGERDQAAKAKADAGESLSGNGADSASQPAGPATAVIQGQAPAASGSPADPAAPANPGQGEAGGAHSPTPLEDLLNDATQGLQGLLNGLKLGSK